MFHAFAVCLFICLFIYSVACLLVCVCYSCCFSMHLFRFRYTTLFFLKFHNIIILYWITLATALRVHPAVTRLTVYRRLYVCVSKDFWCPGRNFRISENHELSSHTGQTNCQICFTCARATCLGIHPRAWNFSVTQLNYFVYLHKITI